MKTEGANPALEFHKPKAVKRRIPEQRKDTPRTIFREGGTPNHSKAALRLSGPTPCSGQEPTFRPPGRGSRRPKSSPLSRRSRPCRGQASPSAAAPERPTEGGNGVLSAPAAPFQAARPPALLGQEGALQAGSRSFLGQSQARGGGEAGNSVALCAGRGNARVPGGPSSRIAHGWRNIWRRRGRGRIPSNRKTTV